MPDLASVLLSQFRAALGMLRDCIARCPAEHWNTPIVKYPFWLVAYHTLCFADFYLSPSESAWAPSPLYHPRGIAELNDEYPSRTFSQPELLAYLEFCISKAGPSLASESAETLNGPSGFPRYPCSRAEFHINSIRHIQHHAAHLGAFLRRAGIDTDWR